MGTLSHLSSGAALSHAWHFITGEYPPQQGGVSDYTHLLAHRLAQGGEAVQVWAPGASDETVEEGEGVTVQRLGRGFSTQGLLAFSHRLARLSKPRRLVVQYVPHAFGLRAMNVPLCLWLAARSEPLWVMMHEVAVPWGLRLPFRLNVLGGAHRLMALLLLRGASKVLVATPAWMPLIAPFLRKAAGEPIWMPIPSVLPTATTSEIETMQTKLLPGSAQLIGHFGTYGAGIAQLLSTALPALLHAEPGRRVVLLGRGSAEFSRVFLADHPTLAGKIVSLGGLPAAEVSAALGACALTLQPYPDGITSRRSTAMASLALGVPLVSNEGSLSEPLWRTSNAVGLAPSPNGELLARVAEGMLKDDVRRVELGRRGKALYMSRFAIENSLQALKALAVAEESNERVSSGGRY